MVQIINWQWDYRMLITKHENGAVTYSLVEAIYDEGNPVPTSFCPVNEVAAESPDRLLRLIVLAGEATDRPPITMVNGTIIETDEEWL